ncbi:hypothetical protein Hsw_3226 [Hymenobacter swuensis DY53]|uniref:Uncharacterized protein n=1 Tax=Hymenobacter swuensis DY53 TaxID=1227739 RepID=W8F871_9BACT|nr:hypothetical protein Hsw_3226 [Hymenobacter swuensis DY53]
MNADEIVRGLSPFQPETVSVKGCLRRCHLVSVDVYLD